MKNLEMNASVLNEEALLEIDGGAWENVWSVGPCEYQYNTSTHKYRWIQTEDYLSYTEKVITNGWVGALGNGYIH